MSSQTNIEQLPLHQFTENAYLNYAMYVILDRALPFIGDGLKPVQRRIIYAMSELGLSAGAKFKKSARTVGDVLGKYHPHGDSACYQAMVLMAQPFSYRYPLIEGQGNWGAPDDAKSFAAMRYTEARLSPISTSLLSELALGTVDQQPNFDGTLQEPQWLPARLPHILLNGTTGIAVGMATDIPPHNIREVARAVARLIDDPQADLSAIMRDIPAPDYPTAAEIITSTADLQALYHSGRGSIKMRAVWQQQGKILVITALPYQVSGSKVLEQIAAQMRAKKLPMVEDLRDESNHETPVRLVIILRATNTEVEPLIHHLLATTELEKSYRVNLNMLGLDGLPAVKNLLTLLREWLAFRRTTVQRRLQYRLEQVLNRLHLLDGLLIAFLNLDTIIAIIRTEDKPAACLMQQFALSTSQAEAILELKLRHLAKLEAEKIAAEQQRLQQEQAQLEGPLQCAAKLDRLIKQELLADAKQYGDARRSPLVTRSAAKALDTHAAVPVEPITVVLSARGWVRCAKGHEVDPPTLSYKSGDVYQAHAQGNSHQPVVFLDSTGRSYTLDPLLLPSARGQGELLNGKLTLPPTATIQQVVMADPQQLLLLACDAGYGFICSFADCLARTRSGKQLVTLPKHSQLLAPLHLNDRSALLLAITSVGRLLLFPISQLPQLAKGKGNKIITMSAAADKQGAKQRLIHLAIIATTAPAITLQSGKRKMVLKTADIAKFIAKRGDKGTLLPRGLRHVDQVS